MHLQLSNAGLARRMGLVVAGLTLVACSSVFSAEAPAHANHVTRLAPWPPDLPLPTAKPIGGWIETARIVQPCHTTGWLVVSQHKTWAKRFSEEFGFNAISISVPDSHNATGDPISPAYGYDKTGKFRYDDELFTQAMESFRAAGLRTIMYSSIMHCGHAWKWETGQLGKEHPDWSQIDAKGTPVMIYGRPWLCPSSPAFDYCLRWTIEAVRRWKYDAVMLDNNEFFSSPTPSLLLLQVLPGRLPSICGQAVWARAGPSAAGRERPRDIAHSDRCELGAVPAMEALAEPRLGGGHRAVPRRPCDR